MLEPVNPLCLTIYHVIVMISYLYTNLFINFLHSKATTLWWKHIQIPWKRPVPRSCISSTVYMNNSIVYPRRRKKTFISERSLFSPLVFNNAYLHSGIITPFVHRFVSEYVLDRAHETMDDLNIQYTDIIFLHTAAPVCYERVRQRHRSCEVNNITLDYLYVLERE